MADDEVALHWVEIEWLDGCVVLKC